MTSPRDTTPPAVLRRAGRAARPVVVATLLLCLTHTALIVLACGGPGEIASPWPMWRHDHPLWVHVSWVGPELVARTGSDAGLDPWFMAGYAKSVVFPQAAAYYEAVALVLRPFGLGPARAHKLAVLLGTALPPWLILAAALRFRLRAGAAAGAVALFLLYVWTDGGGAGFPLNYAWYGMVPYLLAVPLGLLALAELCRWLEDGGAGAWLRAAALLALTWMVHLTTPMVLAPAGLTAYLMARRQRDVLTTSRRNLKYHLGFWSISAIILVANAWWWVAGVVLWGTKGESGFAFSHSGEPVWDRLAAIAWSAPTIQAVLLALLVPGLIAWRRSAMGRRSGPAAVAVVALAGFGWGYLAGIWPQMDFLQPGRQTYALHLSAALLGGVALAALVERAASWRRPLGVAAAAGALLVGVRFFGPEVAQGVVVRLGLQRGGEPFLTSRPPDRLRWILKQVEAHVKPGERLLYEEAGADIAMAPDPYGGGRFSGLLPWMRGVEVIGGPYLRAALTTNHTQFGEGKLLGVEEWGVREWDEAVELYGVSAVVCWSPRALAFCEAHPERVEVVARDVRPVFAVDPRSGRAVRVESTLLVARVRAAGGPVARGRAKVEASTGRLRVADANPGEANGSGELDGLVVLRYHLLPSVRGVPAVRLEPVRRGTDPVPFVGIRPPPTGTVLELDVLP